MLSQQHPATTDNASTQPSIGVRGVSSITDDAALGVGMQIGVNGSELFANLGLSLGNVQPLKSFQPFLWRSAIDRHQVLCIVNAVYCFRYI